MAKISHLLIALALGLSLSHNAIAQCKNIKISGLVDRDTLIQDIRILSSDKMNGRKNGTPELELARNYISARYREIGLSAFEQYGEYRQSFLQEKWLKDIQGVNIIGWIKGTKKPDEFIVVTAHYDHMGSSGKKIFNGADDNASGVAGMLALAHQLAESPPVHSVVFVATDAEEKGLIGAHAFVSEPPVPLEQMKANLNLDMLSQGGFKKRLYVFGVRQHPSFSPLFKRVKEQSGLCLRRGRQGIARGFSESRRINWRMASDHGAFFKKGIPFLFVGVDVHHLYHTEDDTFENIESDFYVAAVESSLMLLKGLDGLNFEKVQSH